MRRPPLLVPVAAILILILSSLFLLADDTREAALRRKDTQDAILLGKAPLGTSKIESTLAALLQTRGTSDFIVRFTEQADLTPAYGMDRETRGRFVFQSLTDAANRSQEAAKGLLDSRGIKYRTFIAGNELYVYAGDLAAVESLASLPEAAEVSVPMTFQVPESTASVQATTSWGITDTGADQFWDDFLVQGNGIVVASIGTGVEWDHPALVNQFRCPGDPDNPACWHDPGNICGPGGACDDLGNGTHTTGTMVAANDPDLSYVAGMAPNAQWIACKACDAGGSCPSDWLGACADWILAPDGNPANSPHVVNMSLSYPGGDTFFLSKVEAWRAAGIFPALSCGNGGPACNSLRSPGDYQESFCSAGHDSGRTIAWWSGRGPSFDGHSPYTKPNISAPGVGIYSTYPGGGWTTMSGSSMASPHSAGAVALLWSCNPTLIGNIDQTFELLQDNADPPPAGDCGPPPDGEGNYTYGYGHLNVLAAGEMACVTGGQHGTLNGHVYDQRNGRALSGAKVTAKNGAYIRYANTQADGAYSLTLPPGSYDVKAVKVEFDPVSAAGVTVVNGMTTTQDFSLPYRGWVVVPSMCFDLTRLDAEYFPATQKIYVLGGRSGFDTTDGNIYVFDPVAGTCTDTGADMPTPVSNYTVNLVNDGADDLLCIFGGRASASANTLEVQCYNPLTNEAFVRTSLPAAFTDYVPGGQAVVNNRVYVFGGFRSTSAPYTLAVTFRYDPVSNSFSRLGDLSLARSYIMVAVVDGVIYAFGGDTYDGSLISDTRSERMADPEGAGTWDDAAVADLPGPNAEGRAFGFDSGSPYALRGRVVLAGGRGLSSYTDDVLTYHVVTNSYSADFPDLNQARRNHAGVFAPVPFPRMWVFGGFAGYDYPPFAKAEYFTLSRFTPPALPGVRLLLLSN